MHNVYLFYRDPKGQRNGFILIFLFLLSFLSADTGRTSTESPVPLTDPYKIFSVHYAATGGLEPRKALRGCYSSGRVENDGMCGTFQAWERLPLQYRIEEDFGIIQYVMGDSGVKSWYQDTNAQVDIYTDTPSLQRRMLSRWLNKFEHLDRNSSVFTLTIEDDETINDRDCYSIRMENSINRDITWYYFDKHTFYLHASKTRLPDISTYTIYTDFREVEGLIFPFHIRTDIPVRDKFHEIWIDTLDVDAEMDLRLFEVPHAAPPEIRFTSSESAAGVHAVKIPFLFVDGGIYIHAAVGGEKAWWQLDSGASCSVVDQKYASRCGLESGGAIKGFGFGGNFDAGFVEVPCMRLGSATRGIEIDAQTIMSSAGLAQTSYEPERQGIIGYDYLRHFVVHIDYAAEIVTFYPADTLKDVPESLNWQDAPLKYRMPTLKVCVDGELPGTFSIDTGAEHSSFYRPYVEKYGLDSRPGIEHVSQGISGVNIDTLVRFNYLRIAGHTLKNPVFSVAAPVSSGTDTIGELAGNIGASVLQNFDVWLDLQRQRVALEPGSEFNTALKLDMSGILVGMSHTGEPMVSYTGNDTPASNAGVEAGDIILEVDGVNVEKLGGVRGIRLIFRGPEHKCFDLKLLRAGETLYRKICLRRLL